MALFGRKNNETSCCCGCSCDQESMEAAENAKNDGARVRILGAGCVKCNDLERNVKTAMQQAGINPDIDHVTDFTEIAAYGVMTTPALVIDGKVVSLGKVLSAEEVKKLL